MINLEQIQQIAAKIDISGVGENTVSALRQNYPDIHFTYCMDDDIVSHKPVVSRAAFNLYLIDGREHCLCLTNDPTVATGLVVAEILDDSE